MGAAAEDRLSRVFAALADPTRRDMVSRLAVGDATVNELAAPYDVSVQAVSKHLRILTECRLLRQEAAGREIYYHFNPREMREVAEFIEPFRQLWDTKYNQLDKVLANLKSRKS